jgi:hypothetical protein
MSRSLALLALLIAFSPASAQDIQGPSWTPLSFAVYKPDPKNILRSASAGTRVTALLDIPARKVVSIDFKKSMYDSYTDDKDTNLLAVPAAAAGLGRQLISPGPLNANEITFFAPSCPTRGASRVRIKGSVVALIGKDEKEVEKKDFSLKEGGKLDFGSIKPQDLVTLKMKLFQQVIYDGTRPLNSVKVLDVNGNELPCQVSTTQGFAGLLGLGEKPGYRAVITITGNEVDRCTLKIKYFDSVEELTVPFDLEVGPGF